jgi:hypothetical protein
MLFDDFRSEQLGNLLGRNRTELFEVVVGWSLEYFLNEQSLRINAESCPSIPKPATLHYAALVVKRLLLGFRHYSDFSASFILHIQNALSKSAFQSSSLVYDTVALTLQSLFGS